MKFISNNEYDQSNPRTPKICRKTKNQRRKQAAICGRRCNVFIILWSDFDASSFPTKTVAYCIPFYYVRFCLTGPLPPWLGDKRSILITFKVKSLLLIWLNTYEFRIGEFYFAWKFLLTWPYCVHYPTGSSDRCGTFVCPL